MRKTLLALTVLLAGIIAVGLFLAQLPEEAVSITFNGREAEGLARVLAAGTAGMFGLLLLAAGCLVVAFILCGASVLVALLFAGAGGLLIFLGLPFLAPLVVLLGLLYLALRSRNRTRDAV